MSGGALPFVLEGKGPSLGEEREGAGFPSSPLPPSKLYIKIPIQSSHRGGKKNPKALPSTLHI